LPESVLLDDKNECVTRGLDPRVHLATGKMDARVKLAHDAILVMDS